MASLGAKAAELNCPEGPSKKASEGSCRRRRDDHRHCERCESGNRAAQPGSDGAGRCVEAVFALLMSAIWEMVQEEDVKRCKKEAGCERVQNWKDEIRSAGG